jgi:hypothetical protein
MTLQQELSSWLSPTPVETFAAPEVGSIAPSTPLFALPSNDSKPIIITFLRHCGCPCVSIFSQLNPVVLSWQRRESRALTEVQIALNAQWAKSRQLTCDPSCREDLPIAARITAKYAHPDIRYIVASHSDKPSTDKWIEAVGGAGQVEVIVDPERTTYGRWSLGMSSFWHVLNPWSMSNVLKVGREEKGWNRPTESGSRWQICGTFSGDRNRVVTYVQVAQAADEIGDFEKTLKSLP